MKFSGPCGKFPGDNVSSDALVGMPSHIFCMESIILDDVLSF